jgi:hypothetical protein
MRKRQEDEVFSVGESGFFQAGLSVVNTFRLNSLKTGYFN